PSRSPAPWPRAALPPMQRKGRGFPRHARSDPALPFPLSCDPWSANIGLGEMTPPDQSMPPGQVAEIEWQAGGVPVASRFDDPYFSLANGLAETLHVFLAGNDLPARLRPGLHIAELGFGTGLNMLATLIAGGDVPLRYTSFEAWPMAAQD